MQLLSVILVGYRSVDHLEFEAGPFTVLFGKNNTGKTNILEAIYDVIHSQSFQPAWKVALRGTASPTRRRESEFESESYGALVMELQDDVDFDADVVAAFQKVGLTGAPRNVAFTDGGLYATDPHESYSRLHASLRAGEHVGELSGIPAITFFEGLEPIETPKLTALFLDWKFNELNEGISTAVGRLVRVVGEYESAWLEPIDLPGVGTVYRLRQDTLARLDQFAVLTTDFLPDFLDGTIEPKVNPPTVWQRAPKVVLEYAERGRGQATHPLFGDLEIGDVEGLGQGAARWIAAAAQVALRVITDHPDVAKLRDLGVRGTGYVLLVDEPEAHLHPSAVASIVRWCQRMVSHGFTVIVASHHEEFLRLSGDEVTLVHVTRDVNRVYTNARTLPIYTTTRLQELAEDVGLHPASALSLHRAILFVEGPLDEAVLDEFAGLELDAAGIKLLPIHGTKNIEGIVAVELVTNLGIKLGVLTDATDPRTMADRPGRKRSSEERKVLRVFQISEEKGIPKPAAFGVPEDDLLFALPAEAIRDYLNGPFPGWKELVVECRNTLGKGPSDSVDWKAFAQERYRLPITTPAGVREVVRFLDLNGVPLPSIRTVVDEIIDWARSPVSN
ncbi:ATP-dependent nuclease [Mycobacterium asiaticum]|uniref:ATP-dependent nuclease n=1 Tax=Mycobacterium asiaticum TaxID=1790 RepID=UPI0007EF5155|nr:AAA family ATPase [Mycobacterium asiaticum]